MTRSREILLWVLFAALVIAFAATVPGCHRMPRFGEKMTGEALGRADARQLYIIEEAKVVQPKDAGKRITVFASDTRKDIEEAAKKHPEIELKPVDAQNKSETQQAQVRDFIQQKVDLIIISPKESRPLTRPGAGRR